MLAPVSTFSPWASGEGEQVTGESITVPLCLSNCWRLFTSEWPGWELMSSILNVREEVVSIVFWMEGWKAVMQKTSRIWVHMLRVQWSLQWNELWPQQPALCSLHKTFISGEGSHLSILLQRYSSMHAQFAGWHQSIHFPTQVDLYFFPLCDLLSNGYHEAHRRGFMIFEANILGKHAVWVVYSWMNKKSGIPSIAGWKENNCMHSSWWEWNSFWGEKLDI